MAEISNYEFHFVDLVIIEIFNVLVVLALLTTPINIKRLEEFLAKNTFNAYSITTMLGIVIIIYRDQLVDLISNPPPYVFLIAVGLYFFTVIQNSNKDLREAQQMFTAAQMKEIKTDFGTQVADLRTEVGAQISDLETKVGAQIADLETKVDNVEIQLRENNGLLQQVLAAVLPKKEE